ncbi:MAG: alpha/beta hydrolase fold domain-containing protein [Candidatus Pelagibacterales bacterium]|tara:strand:- start:937 stop:2040 length:1104 start_codon:yes stop_codon:yes gene_type:complete
MKILRILIIRLLIRIVRIFYRAKSDNNAKLANDPRIDPRIKKNFWFDLPPREHFKDRDEMMKYHNSAYIKKEIRLFEKFSEIYDDIKIAPKKGLIIETKKVKSHPDGNIINLQFIRPDNEEILPCIYYIHGGGMEYLSCYYGNYRAWGRLLAHQNVAVVMVDFRNATIPSSVPEVAEFPAGLNDCISGLKWTHENSNLLKIDKSKIIVAGESGGGNLTLATGMALKKENNISLIKGLFALCPYIAGIWPLESNPSSITNNGIFLDLNDNPGPIAYGIQELHNKNPLAWPGFASIEDVQGLPPTCIHVNECDPLRDEGYNFYRLLKEAKVETVFTEAMGTIHGTELFVTMCPDVSIKAAKDIAKFSRS